MYYAFVRWRARHYVLCIVSDKCVFVQLASGATRHLLFRRNWVSDIDCDVVFFFYQMLHSVSTKDARFQRCFWCILFSLQMKRAQISLKYV